MKIGKWSWQHLPSKIQCKTEKFHAGFDVIAGLTAVFRIIQHVLPTGLHRVRNFGFLHHNAKKTLLLIQLILRVFITAVVPRSRPAFTCRHCHSEMVIQSFRWSRRSG